MTTIEIDIDHSSAMTPFHNCSRVPSRSGCCVRLAPYIEIDIVRRRLLLVLCLTALALVGLGCGGDEGSDASNETVVGQQIPCETKSSSEAAVDVLGVRCVELATISATFSQSLDGKTGSLDDVRYLLDSIADTVPAEMEDDYEVLVASFGKIAEALQDVDFGYGTTQNPEDLQKIQKLAATLDVGKVRGAATSVEAWAKANC